MASEGRKKVRLTKKRMAITLDDVMYERFRRMQEDVYRATDHLRRQLKVAKIVQKQGNLWVVLRIEKCEFTPNGVYIEVK